MRKSFHYWKWLKSTQSCFSEFITSQPTHFRRLRVRCRPGRPPRELSLFSEACLMPAPPLDTVPSFLFSAVGLHILQLPPWAHTRFPEKWTFALNFPFYVRRNSDRQLGLAVTLHLHRCQREWTGPGMPPLPQGVLLPTLFFLEENPHQHPLQKRLQLLVR